MTDRTPQQNKALHKYFDMLADVLNEAGLDQRVVLKPGIDIPWSRDSIKEQLWRPIQLAMTGKESTTELDTKEPSQIYETLNRHLAAKLGVHVEFPNDEAPTMGESIK